MRESVSKAAIWLLPLIAFFCAPVWGEDPPEPLFGIEHEVRSPLNLISPALLLVPLNYIAGKWLFRVGQNDPIAGAAQRSYLRKMEHICKQRGNCRVEGDKVIYPEHDWYFRITRDPITVECPTAPSSLKKLKEMKELIANDMFKVPGQLGLRGVKSFLSGGHVHIDIATAFRNDPRRFLNFVIDYVNHSELYMGGLLYDPWEAPPPLKKEGDQAAFKRLVADFDAGKVTTIDQMIDRLAEAGFHKISGTANKSALNAKTKYRTIEVRANRSFTDIDQFIDTVELFHNRIGHLDKREGRLPWYEAGQIDTVAQGVAQFHQYVTEAGMEWDRFKKLLPESWQRVRPDFSALFKKGKPITWIKTCRFLFHGML